ncbi:MAG TPA: cytochrome bc complex cytochrome b subunit [Candidatus Caenarcaniphilales bacterium]|nr:cytochrome bc complex cytochrome b subunit [Candidatus Caenarcaniphilales bacterium]
MRRLPFPRRDRADGVRAVAPDAVEQPDRPTELERVVGWFDERTGMARYARTGMAKVFPDHWSFLLGEVALFCFIILVLTGTFLTFFYTPDARLVTYEGAYEPLRGAQVSAAYASVLDISFEVRAGLLMRQIHHWTALVFVGVIAIHMMRVFFTGAFRRPRELNWLIGGGLLLLGLAEGFTGYSLPDDLLSGTGMRITYGALLSIPFIGPNLAFLVFGGEFPTEIVVSRLFVFHVMLLPGLYVGAITLHILLTWIQKHTSYKGTGATEEVVVGPRFWPVQVFRSVGLFFMTFAVLALVSAVFQINPVWTYGPFLPHIATVPAQPDWYVGWLEGALRLGLPIEPTILGVTIPSPFIPGVLIPGLVFGMIMLWPWIEAVVTRDRKPHHILDWPWEAAGRTATGVAVLAFFLVQTVAGGNDVLSVLLRMNVDELNTYLRILLVGLPIFSWLVTYRLCKERQRRATAVTAAAPAGPIRRTAEGGFVDEGHR